MGMFDEVKIDYSLPWPEVQDAVWQSKDTPDQYGTPYVVCESGRLWKHREASDLRVTLGGSIECHTSLDGKWYSVTFWIRAGVVKDAIYKTGVINPPDSP